MGKCIQVNQLSESLLSRRLLPCHHAPTQLNKEESFGVDYLYRQAGRAFVISEDPTPSEDDLTDEVDEGFVDNSAEAPSISEDMLTVGVGAPANGDEEEEEEEEEEDDYNDDEYEEVLPNCY